jgi:hypothetical protein
MNVGHRILHVTLSWRTRALLGVLVTFAAASCQGSGPGADASASAATSTGKAAGKATPTAAIASPSSSAVVVTVNGEPITEADLATGLPANSFKETLDAARDIKLERLTQGLTMRQFLKSQKIEVAQSEIDADLANLEKNPPSAGCPCCRYESLDQFMKLNYISQPELVQMSRNQLGFTKYMDAQWQTAYPTPEARRALLKAKRTELEGKYFKAYHIFFNAAQDPAFNTDEAGVLARKKQQAEAAWKRLQGGESFEAVAKAVSEDKVSAIDGGYLGYVTKGAFGKEFSEALSQLAAGATSKVVTSPWGCHIIRREAMTDDDLLKILKEDFQEAKAKETLQRLEQDTKIERPDAAAASPTAGK